MNRPFTKSILIIDDESDIRQIAKDLLVMHFSDEKFMFCEASNGSEAAVRFSQQKFDLIIMDLRMPKRDGITTLKDIFNLNDEVKPRNILIISGYVPEGTRFPPGVDFLAKPFGQNDFVIKIHDIFENQKIKQSKSLTYKRI